MKKIVVTGSNGQLGSEFQDLAGHSSEFEFYFFSRNELDITNEAAVNEQLAAIKPDYLINCAAYTAVDKAEADQENAFLINASAVGILAVACSKLNSKFIHISTDYVFDGQGNKPYNEDDQVSPVNLYGQSKLKGEEEALRANGDTMIIRTAWVYSSFGNNFVKTMLRLMNTKPEIGVVSDQVGTPTYAKDIAEAILQIIKSGKWVPGIYHFSNEGVISWYEFAAEIKNQVGTACKVNAISTAQYPTPAKRPNYSVLDKTKITSTFSLALKDWKKSLAECLQKIAQ